MEIFYSTLLFKIYIIAKDLKDQSSVVQSVRANAIHRMFIYVYVRRLSNTFPQRL